MIITYRADRADAPVPAGAIRFRQEIIDLVSEARETNEPIRVWTVAQGGYLGAFRITPRSRFEVVPHMADVNEDGCYWSVTDTVTEYGFDGEDQVQSYEKSDDEIMGSHNIECSVGNCHYAFTNGMMARRYSDELKNDEVYQQSVRDHHAYCAHVFADLDDYDYDYGYDHCVNDGEE